MESVEERVAYLEGRGEDHSQMVNGIRDALVSLEARMDRRFEGIDRRFEAIDAKMSKQFVWLVGMQVTTLLAVAGGFAAVASGFASVAGGMASLATAIAAR